MTASIKNLFFLSSLNICFPNFVKFLPAHYVSWPAWACGRVRPSYAQKLKLNKISTNQCSRRVTRSYKVTQTVLEIWTKLSQKDVVVLFHKGSIFSQTSGRARPGLTDNRQETKGQQYNSNWEENCSFVSQVQSQKISFHSIHHL